MNPDQPHTQRFSAMRIGVLVVAAIGVILSAIGLLQDTSHFFRVYLVGWLLWAQLAVGCLGIVMLNTIINGRWFYPVLRFAEAGARTIPLVGVLMIPILIGQSDIYIHWVGAELEGGKDVYLTSAFFLIRQIAYFVIWSAFAFYLSSVSYRRDREEIADYDQQQRNVGALGLVVFVLTTTLASYDWTMSLEPEWISTSYGWVELARMGLTTMPFLFLMSALFWNEDGYGEAVTDKLVGDFAELLLVTSLVWAYLNGITFVVIWSGNVSYYAFWFTDRLADGWVTFTAIMTMIHAGLIIAMLIPGLKGRRSSLVALAGITLAIRVLEAYWLVLPSFTESFSPWWWDLGPALMIGAALFGAFGYLYEREAMLPAYHISNVSSEGHHNITASKSEAEMI
ncbi:MAG: hypothetical protein AAFV98_06270 [Chloroflexota bacterium]